MGVRSVKQRLTALQKRCDWLDKRIRDTAARGALSFDREERGALLWALYILKHMDPQELRQLSAESFGGTGYAERAPPAEPHARHPNGATCEQCVHITRCLTLGTTIKNARQCDWIPSRFLHPDDICTCTLDGSVVCRRHRCARCGEPLTSAPGKCSDAQHGVSYNTHVERIR